MRTQRFAAVVLAAIWLAGCAQSTTDDVESPDGRDDVALADGKADNLWGECETREVLDILNDPTTTDEALDAMGLHARASNNLERRRNGEDGVPGTEDDFVYESLEDVDDTYYVGPVAMNQLLTAVADRCVVQASRTEVIFSPQPYDQSHLARTVELIDNAERSIDIGMYSFRDENIFDALESAADRGVSIRMIFEPAQEDRLDPEGTRSDRLEKMGIDVRYVNKIMHHKFALIDGPREDLAAADDAVLITGSGNWSNSAGTRYDENTVVIHGNSEINTRFQKEFNHMWEHSRDFVHSVEHEYFESVPVTDGDVVDDPSVDAAFTSANFRIYMSSRWGWTFSVQRGKNEIADLIVSHIEEAEDSIWVASGHLRSRPISEALLQKWEENPDMDIRIYLDGQEYVSWWAHNEEVEDRADCLEEAGDSKAQQEDCWDKGYHYSWDVKEEGIPTRFKFYSYRWHYTYAEQMHHKYIIIDGEKVLSGSYNFSDNAEHNTLENIIVYDAAGFPDLVDAFEDNFLAIWDTGEGEYDPLMEEVRTSSRVPIVFDSMALTWQQVNDLKSAISDACPDVNSTDYRRHPERHFVCFVD